MRSDLRKSFQPILEESRMLSLRPLSGYFDGGITRVQFPIIVGVHFPKGSIRDP
jgi:hypothetical protein